MHRYYYTCYIGVHARPRTHIGAHMCARIGVHVRVRV